MRNQYIACIILAVLVLTCGCCAMYVTSKPLKPGKCSKSEDPDNKWNLKQFNEAVDSIN